MIYGNLEDLKTYKGITHNLDVAIDYIISGEYKNCEIGKTEIDLDKIYFVRPEELSTMENKGQDLEFHKKYIDMHLVLEGEENIGVSYSDNFKTSIPYDEEKDVEFVSGEVEQEVYMDENRFLILFPEELHLPLLKVGEEKKIKKIIFKIEI